MANDKSKTCSGDKEVGGMSVREVCLLICTKVTQDVYVPAADKVILCQMNG